MITLAAGFLGLGFVAQHHAAYREPLGRMPHLSLLLDLARRPLWLAGVGAMLCGQILGALALSRADVTEVEPLLATNLVFALAIGRIVGKENLTAGEWLGGAWPRAASRCSSWRAVRTENGRSARGPGAGSRRARSSWWRRRWSGWGGSRRRRYGRCRWRRPPGCCSASRTLSPGGC